MVALLSLSGISVKAAAIAPVSGAIKAGVEYSIPATGNSVDEFYTTSEVIEAGKTIVVFYYNHSADAIWGQSPIYFGPAGDNPLSRDKNLKDKQGNSVCKLIPNPNKLLDASGHAVIEIYQPKEDNATWAYVICSSEEAASVEIPDFGGGDTPTPPVVVPGQNIENAIALTAGVSTEFTSYDNGARHLIYVKIVPESSGIVTVNVDAATSSARWMEEGVMSYGQIKQNYFSNKNQFNAEKGKTYYCLFNFTEETKSTISYSIEAAEAGSIRSSAILLDANTTKDLFGIPHSGDDYFNKTTWFKIEKDGALKDNDLAVITIGGKNESGITLYVDDEELPSKSYLIGTGSGMLPEGSSVKLDIDLTQHSYYIAISQNDVDGTASFVFRVAEAGETMLKAFTAVVGENQVSTAGWYKYTHSGDRKLLKISGISNIYNENGGNVAEGDDVKIGFIVGDGTTVYFRANVGSFTITLADVEKGMSADNPVIITNDEGAKFSMGSSAATDAYRYMQYSATEDGTFMYATQNAKVLEFCNSATVRDITDPNAIKAVNTIQEKSNEFGAPYFIYKWTVVAGHTYLIEQGLGNNYGTVEFFPLFKPAEEGETIGKAIAINLNEAKDLGRTVTTPKYYKFTASEAGNYLVSVQMVGYVRSYDADLKPSSISRSYTDGLDYHNATFALAQGETLIFSCEASQAISRELSSGINDAFLPNYYATVTKAEDSMGLDYSSPVAIAIEEERNIGTANIWHGPVNVPAGATLYVVANTNAEKNAIYFAAPDQYGMMQWVNKSADIYVETSGKKQIYTLMPSGADRNIQIMSYGMACVGTFKATFTKPSITDGIDNAVISDDELDRQTGAKAPVVYTLEGQQLKDMKAMQAGQIYILNGKKVMKK